MSSVQQIEEQKTWRPDQGDVNPLVGRVADVSTATGEHGSYPLVEIVDDGGCTWSFHAFREVAENELRELAPEIGDEISVHFLGQPAGKTYYRYKIRFADGRGKKIDWTKFGGELRGARTDTELEAIEPDQGDEPPY